MCPGPASYLHFLTFPCRHRSLSFALAIHARYWYITTFTAPEMLATKTGFLFKAANRFALSPPAFWHAGTAKASRPTIMEGACPGMRPYCTCNASSGRIYSVGTQPCMHAWSDGVHFNNADHAAPCGAQSTCVFKGLLCI